MSREEILNHIIGLNLQVAPDIDKNDNIVGWVVGQVKYDRGLGCALVHNKDIARGTTLEEAITNLIDGHTIWNTEIAPIHNSIRESV